MKLPLFNENDAFFRCVCLDQITVQFPKYPLQERVERDIRNGYKQIGDVKNLPNLPRYVGGNTDFMIGIKYLRYYPKKIFQLPSGLSIYKSWFKNSDSSRGVIGGPHEVFTRIESTYQAQTTNFLSNQYHMFKNGFQINPDLLLLHTKVEKDYIHDLMVESSEKGTYNDEKTDDFKQSLLIRNQKVFEKVENSGSETSFRCSKCYSCKSCKEHDQSEILSVREEVEQNVINNSVEVNIKNRVTIASLSFNAESHYQTCS